ITLEPTDRPWIFTLDQVDRSPRPDIFIAQSDRQLTTFEPGGDAITYEATSHLATRAQTALSKLAIRTDTRLPADRNPRALALARTLRAGARSDADYARRMLDWFRDNGLTYTL